ncbi:MAG: tetratricopeptide repeat protein [Pseudomonadota bacterium]
MQQTAQSFEVTPDNFQSAVVERSRQVPVILVFWADQVPPSAELRRTLEAVARPYEGKVDIATVDVSQDQTLAQHLRVQGLPSLRVVHDGQIVEQLDGPQTEGALRQLLDQLTTSPAEMLREELTRLMEAGQYDQALGILQQAIQEEPHNQGFRVELADVLALKGDAEQARRALADVAADAEERDRPQTRIEFLEEAEGLDTAESLERRLAADPEDLEARYQLAVREAVAAHYEQALEHALAVLRTDREFRDDIGRLTMIRIFKLLGKGSELASRYRRRMFNFMH